MELNSRVFDFESPPSSRCGTGLESLSGRKCAKWAKLGKVGERSGGENWSSAFSRSPHSMKNPHLMHHLDEIWIKSSPPRPHLNTCGNLKDYAFSTPSHNNDIQNNDIHNNNNKDNSSFNMFGLGKGKWAEDPVLCVTIFPVNANTLRRTVFKDLDHGQQTLLHHVHQVIFEYQPTCQA